MDPPWRERDILTPGLLFTTSEVFTDGMDVTSEGVRALLPNSSYFFDNRIAPHV